MPKDRGPRRADDEDEGEETVFDLQARSTPPARAPTPTVPTVPTVPIKKKRAFVDEIPSETVGDPQDSGGEDSDDEDATEFLSRPSLPRGPLPPPRADGSGPVFVARGRAVPLSPAPDDDVPSPKAGAGGPFAVGMVARTDSGDRTEPHNRRKLTASSTAGPLPRATPRPLPKRSTSLPSQLESQTGSVPTIHKLGGEKPARDTHDDLDEPLHVDDAPQAHATASKGVAKAIATLRRREQRGKGASEEEELATLAGHDDDATGEPLDDGMLVIDVPPEATTFVNGEERGRGQVRIERVDRYAKHALRVHCPGYHAWTGTVSLDGKPALKVKPALKKRG